MNIGAHVSIAGGFDKCLDRGSQMGCEGIMTFASSPRSLKFNQIDPDIIEVYKNKKSATSVKTHYFHGVYLVNLASSDPDYLKVSIESLTFYQQLAHQIGGQGTIFHIGSHKGEGFDKTIDTVINSINQITKFTHKDQKLILENTAGHKGTIGSLDELSSIMEQVQEPSKIGICLDTQHLFASGKDLEKVLDEFDHKIGLKYLEAIHLNDSKTEFGSKLDRHENIGKGKIGSKLLKQFLKECDQKRPGLTAILEVPGAADSGPQKEDVDIAKNLLDN